MRRKYKSGTRWCVWRWTDVDSEYITRLHLVKTPWFAVCLHWLNKPDAEPYLHDHPVTFLSCILRGGYIETRQQTPGWPHYVERKWFNFIRATHRDRHRIDLVRPHTLTLCFMGPKKQEWGFFIPDATGITKVYWKDYYARLREDRQRLDSVRWGEQKEAGGTVSNQAGGCGSLGTSTSS